MFWLNYYRLAIAVAIMAPNIINALKNKKIFPSNCESKSFEIAQQVGGYGSLFFLMFNLPFTYIGWFFTGGELVYLIVNGVLVVAYNLIQFITRKKNNLVRALLLSILPSTIFIFSGIMIISIPLIIFSLLFAACYITSCIKNANRIDQSPKKKRNAIVTIISIALSFFVLGSGAYGVMIVKYAVPFIEAKNMTAAEMIEYDVKNSDNKISVAVIKNGKIASTIYGTNGKEYAVYDYEIGSISKTFLGLIYAKLVSESTVSLDDSIGKYLDLEEGVYYPTICRLLTHTSGYENYYFEMSMLINMLYHTTPNTFYGTSKETLLNRVKKTSLENRDYKFCYSNFDIAVLGLVLEKIYKRNYTDIMNDFIRDELGLTNTIVAKQRGNLDGYWKWKAYDAYLPAGSIISNINDMSTYLQTCLAAKGYIAKSFASIATVNANDPFFVDYGIRTDYIGMTWMRDDVKGYVWHDGATSEFSSYIAIDRERGIGVVLLGNIGMTERITLTIIGAKMMSELIGIDNVKWLSLQDKISTFL